MSAEVVVMHHEEPQTKHGPSSYSRAQDWSAYAAECFPRESRGPGAQQQEQQQQHMLAPASSSSARSMDDSMQTAPGEAASGEAASGEAASGEAASGEAASGEAAPTLKRHRPDTPTSTLKASPNKARRVRTGCLTCRERHLKCDEAAPDCMNCRKRGRECKRGLRLNFLDVNLHRPACVAPLEDWTVQFLDESRDIAAEYSGGLGRYAPYDSKPGSEAEPASLTRLDKGKEISRPFFSPVDHPRSLGELSMVAVPPSSHRSMHSEPPLDVALFARPPPDGDFFFARPPPPEGDTSPRDDVSSPSRTPTSLLAPFSEAITKLPSRDRLNTPEEIRYMQVFVEQVGAWLDAFNAERQFSHLIPYHALRSTMVLNASLACGAKHMSFACPAESDTALHYHNTATSQLLRSLQNPDRNMADCAATAVVLNVYEFMSEKPAHRMRHIGGARALILECGWDARSSGAGAACFWQNITMELLICLSTPWPTTWDPEDWGLDLGFVRGEGNVGTGGDEVFVHQILYIVAKVVNFRAAGLRPVGEGLGERLGQWRELQRLCDGWNEACPRTMHSYGYMKSSTANESTFPCIWLIRRTAILGRLFYHTAQCILAQHHPVQQMRGSPDTRALRLHHAHQACGIVAHTRDAGIAPVAIRCLAIAAAALREPREQAEVLDMLGRIGGQGGWHTAGVEAELRRAWGWERHSFSSSSSSSSAAAVRDGFRGRHQNHDGMPPPTRPSLEARMSGSGPPLLAVARALTPPVASMAPVNPLSFADFSLPIHPYQNWYEPPSRPAPR